ncbi:MAG: metalloregulator ArsR/SmtB family transcription factor [Acidimicrobiia bacterium]|nr:metalloregulator ArsR/SmtB family transcription factor [Acidimicrobiia bacterium]
MDIMKHASAFFRLLGDPTRLRLLRVLARDRFNVSELTGILDLAQSGVSRHLGLLKEAGLVAEERAGGHAYYRLATPDANGHGAVRPLLEAEFGAAANDGAVRADEARLQEVLRVRKENFESHGEGRQLVPGRSWAAWSRALGHLLPALDVADVGCGEGYLTLETARWAKGVVGIDRSSGVLARARALAARRRVSNVRWKKGDLAHLPLPDAGVDVVLLSQALHHAAHPALALGEAARVLRPGGRVLILDLRRHAEGWVRDRLGDRRLGFSEQELVDLLGEAGFERPRITTGARHAGDPFVVVIASGVKSQVPNPGSQAKSQRPGPKGQARLRRRA